MGISTAIRSNAAPISIACALGLSSAHANLTPSYREMVSGAPTLDQVRQYATNLPRSAEVMSQSLYDFQLLPSAGRIVTEFFSTPVGSGTQAFAGFPAPAGKTYADTNMEAPKQLPHGKAFLATSIEAFWRTNFDSSIARRLYSADTATPATAPSEIINGDFNNPQNAKFGVVSFHVENDTVLVESDAYRLGQTRRLGVDGAVSTNDGSRSAMFGLNTPFSENPWVLDPPIFIPPATNFCVRWSYIPPLTLVNTYILGIVLNGYLFRFSQ